MASLSLKIFKDISQSHTWLRSAGAYMTIGNSGQMSNFICLVILGCSKAVNSALWWVQLKRNASPSFNWHVSRGCDATLSTQTQHNNPTNTASRFTVTVSVRYQYVCGRLQSFLVSSLVIDPSAPAKSMSGSAFTFTIPNCLEQISFHSFCEIHPRLSVMEIGPKYLMWNRNVALLKFGTHI